jgi:hypothetical protein
MLLNLSDRFYTLAKGRLILAVFAAFALFMGITLPLLSHFYPASNEMESLDAPAFYTPDEIFSIIESWGAGGRSHQLWFHLTWDVVVPVLGFLTFGLCLSWLWMRAVPPGSRLRRLNLLALASGFDLLENFSLAALIVAYPARPAWVAWLKTIFTMSKYGFGIVIILFLLIGLVIAGRNRFRVQISEQRPGSVIYNLQSAI